MRFGIGLRTPVAAPIAPTVTSSAPSTGNALFATTIVITGTGFTGATSVTVGGVSQSFTVDSPTQITTTAPIHAVGLVAVAVTTPAGTGSGNVYTYAILPGVTGTRTGGNAYVARSASTAAVVASGTTVYEDRGDGIREGVWTFPAITNDVDVDLSTWSLTGTMTETASVAGAPDGTATSYKLEDTDGAVGSKLTDSAAAGQRALSCWVRDASPTPSAAGAMIGINSNYDGASFGTGGTWRRVSSVAGQDSEGMALHPAGCTAPPFPIVSGAQTGAVEIWAPCSIAHPTNIFGYPSTCDVPAVEGASGAAVLAITDVDLTDSGALDYTVGGVSMAGSSELLATPRGDVYLFSGTSAEGVISLRHEQSGIFPSLILRVRGADVLSHGFLGYANGGEIIVRAWYRPASGTSGISVTQNGHTHVVTGTTTGGSLVATTVAHLGSLSGSSGHMNMMWRVLKKHTLADVPVFGTSGGVCAGIDGTTPEFIILGDSLTLSFPDESSGSYIYSAAQRRTRAGSEALSAGGIPLPTIEGIWDESPHKGASYVTAVLIEGGVNDIIVDEVSGAVALTRAQSLIDNIKAANPSAKIIVQKLSPCRGYLGETKYPHWVTYNDGVDSLTDVDEVIDSHVAALGAEGVEGPNYLAGAYDGGSDGLHFNSAGHAIHGLAQRAGLIAAGALV